MVLAFVLISVGAGIFAYTNLPKEGAPNIDVPVLYISVPLPGVSAADSERLLVRPLETEFRGIDNLKQMSGIASENHAGLLLEFDFEWDKQAALADARDRLDRAKAEFPEDAEEPRINEINLSEFPIAVVSLSGQVPERTLLRLAKDLQRSVEANDQVLEAKLTGHREEMLEVLIDPLKMESYGVTAQELLTVMDRNNQLVAAGAIESETASFSVKVPGSFETAADVMNLPVKVSGDRVVRLSDITEIRRTFEDPEGSARYNGSKSVSLQVSKRLGENIIETVAVTRATVAEAVANWPEPLRQAVRVDFSMDESKHVRGMVSQLEGAVATAVLLVMIVVLATLGFRSALLVGIAIPCSFLLSFALMWAFALPISNMVMFGLILAVGMLVDGAIVVVEYADKEIQRGQGPMRAYGAAAKRMFWPITASTATTLCAFLPMLLWPGMPGQFMSQLPTTLIFVLSASLIVALIFLPVLGGVAGRISRSLGQAARAVWNRRAPGVHVNKPYRRSLFGRFIALIALNALGPFVAIGVALAAIAAIFTIYGENNRGTEFFVYTEPERAIVYVRARGNLSIAERDRMVQTVERRVLGIEGVASVFAFTGGGGLTNRTGQEGPPDAIGQVQVELAPWGERPPGDEVMAEIERRVAGMPGITAELKTQNEGPQQGKPVQLELRSNNWAELHEAAAIARAHFEKTEGLQNIDDTRPLPGIEWEITVDREAAGRFGADVAAVTPLVQLVTRGALLGTYRPDDSDDELDIRIRFPVQDRLLTTLDQLKVTTAMGLVPLSNFIERRPVEKLGEINRRDTERYFLVRADVAADVSDIGTITALEEWIETERPFPPSVAAVFTGDRDEQAESQAFLTIAFAGALGLMFIILLAQFNSLYATVLVLSAVVMSVAGVFVGMMVMEQKFSLIMTGTGIVALAGIVVNNNIVLIDTYQELARRFPPLEAIVRTAEARIRPVLLTTITTIAGLTPMMFATSVNFGAIGTGLSALFGLGVFSAAGWGAFTATVLSINAPTALWWVQLATAVVFGLGLATLLTLIVTPAALAARVWLATGTGTIARLARHGFRSQRRRDRRLRKSLGELPPGELVWAEEIPEHEGRPRPLVRAAE